MTARMHHCSICKTCVHQYDHHCPWINGCVGKHNIRLFPCFLFLLFVLMLENAFLDVVGIFKLDFAFKEFRYFEASQDTKDILDIEYILFLSLSLLIIVLFLVPIGALLYYQLTNLLYNVTTYERFSADAAPVQRSSSIDASGNSTELLLDK